MKKTIAFLLPVFFIASVALAADPQSPWAHVGAAGGKLAYQTLPTGDRIMDFSHAGYMGGGARLPAVPVKKTVRPSGRDDTAAIQAAIDAVAMLEPVNGIRGAVLLDGTRLTSAMPDMDGNGKGSPLAEGIFDSHNKPVAPRSLYLAQLAERLGAAALKNIGY